MSTYDFEPNWDTQAVLVEEIQRMAKRIEDLEAMLESQTAPAQPTDEPVAKYSDIVSDGGLDPRNKFDVHPPNEDGKANCIIRWMMETPSGWVGSWDKAALEQFTQPRKWQEIECPCCGELARAFPPALAPEWVGLTDAEVGDALIELPILGNGYFLRIAKAIEAALKEKNT